MLISSCKEEQPDFLTSHNPSSTITFFRKLTRFLFCFGYPIFFIFSKVGLGFAAELLGHNGKNPQAALVLFGLAGLAYVSVWATAFLTLRLTESDGSSENRVFTYMDGSPLPDNVITPEKVEIPDFVWAITGVLFVTFSVFPIIAAFRTFQPTFLLPLQACWAGWLGKYIEKKCRCQDLCQCIRTRCSMKTFCIWCSPPVFLTCTIV